VLLGESTHPCTLQNNGLCLLTCVVKYEMRLGCVTVHEVGVGFCTFKFHLIHCTCRDLSQDGRCPGRDSNERFPITNVECHHCTSQLGEFFYFLSWLFNDTWSSGHSFWLQMQRSWVRFPALPDFLRSSGSGTGFTEPREDN
jgi:hypothetical protein